MCHLQPSHPSGQINYQISLLVLLYGKLSTPKLTEEESNTLYCLNDHPNVVILKDDKSSITMIMNSSYYKDILCELLSLSSCKPLPKSTINRIIKFFVSLDPIIKRCLLPHNPLPPRIY